VSWLTCNPQVSSVIAGATRVDQVHANVAAAQWPLSAEERSEIAELSKR
jgi:aryl-alcohol dehydrogenase-like predicted oxidoreductase